MIREVNDFIGKFGNKDFRFTKKENNAKKEIYRLAIGQCCMPGCSFGLMLEIHHIIPIKKGGTDTFDNYICLCSHCHRRHKIHRFAEERRLELLIYKFYKEGMIIGETCDDYSDEEYWKLLRNFVYKTNHKIKSLKEENAQNEDLTMSSENKALDDASEPVIASNDELNDDFSKNIEIEAEGGIRL